MKRILISSMLVGIMTCSALAFSDVPNDHWAKNRIETLTENGIIAGYDDDTFRPGGVITRAEFYALFARTVMPDEIESQSSGSWWQPFYNAVRGVYTIPESMNNDEAMNSPITRYEMADLVSVSGFTTGYFPHLEAFNFSDLTEEQEYSVIMSVYKGLLTGYEDGTFRPDKNLTRAEASTVISRLMKQQSTGGRIVAANGNTRILVTQIDNIATLQSFDVLTGDTLDSHTDLDATSHMSYEEYEIYAVINYNSKFFWGKAGLFSFDANGMIEQLINRVVIDYSYDSQDNSYVIVTHDSNEKWYYHANGLTLPYGNQIMKFSTDGTETFLLKIEPAHVIWITKVTSEQGQVSFVGQYVMGHGDESKAQYALEAGKLRVLSISSSSYRFPTVAEEQQYLDSLGIGVGS